MTAGITNNVINFGNMQPVRFGSRNENKEKISFGHIGAHGNDGRLREKCSTSTKIGVFTTSVLGVAAALVMMAKHQKLPLNLSKLVNTYKKISITEFQVLGIAGGSVLGGLAGGALFDDKKHLNAKIRESVNQFVGAVGIPLAFVSAASHIFAKCFINEKNNEALFKNAAKTFEKAPFMKNGAKVIAALSALAIGTFAGNKVSNIINEKVSNREMDRGVKITDLAAHVDDLGVAATLMADRGSKLGNVISRFVPLALLVPGYQVGTTKDGQYDKLK
jgi:hypothetical protein